MRNRLLKIGSLTCFVLILLFSNGFRPADLLDLKALMLVILGTLLLTLSGYEWGMNLSDLRAAAAFHALTASYLTTFIYLFGYMTNEKEVGSDHLQAVALTFRPVFYGFFLHIVCRNEDKLIDRKERQEERDAKESPPVRKVMPKEWEKLLTKREMEIAKLIHEGCSNKVIAEKLFISETTVKKHVSNIFEKLQITSRIELRNSEEKKITD